LLIFRKSSTISGGIVREDERRQTVVPMERMNVPTNIFAAPFEMVDNVGYSLMLRLTNQTISAKPPT
jgi:hypothetical protein